jgi:hypothetical protein
VVLGAWIELAVVSCKAVDQGNHLRALGIPLRASPLFGKDDVVTDMLDEFETASPKPGGSKFWR